MASIRHLNGTEEERELDLSQVPGPVVIPSFYEAGILANKPRVRTVPCDYKMIVLAPGTKQIDGSAESVGVKLFVDAAVFAQMLAKIALGIAVAVLGVDGFQPLVRDFILTNPNEYGHWVGGIAGSARVEPKSSELHSVVLKGRGGSFDPFVIVEVRLFAEFWGPTNYVVVGRRL